MSQGKTGGAYGMNVLSLEGLYDNRDQAAANAYHNARDPGELTYIRNPNIWCPELIDQLTCHTIHTDDCGTDYYGAGQCWRHRYGVSAITKRHVVGCAHAFSHAQGTWINGNTTNMPPTRRRWLGKSGATIDRIQISQAGGEMGGRGYWDLMVATLDGDLSDDIYIPRVAPSRFIGELGDWEHVAHSQEWQPGSGIFYATISLGSTASNTTLYRARTPGSGGHGITVSHIVSGSGTSILSIGVVGLAVTVTFGSATLVNTIIEAVNAHSGASSVILAGLYGNHTGTGPAVAGVQTVVEFLAPPSSYPLLNRQMLHVVRYAGYQPSATAPALAYGAYSGDSGSSKHVRLGNELVFSGIVSGAGSESFPLSGGFDWADLLNSRIAASDASAVALGRMGGPTGYTVTRYVP